MRRGQGGHLAPEPGRLAHISVAGTSTTASIPVAFVYLAARIVDVGVWWAVAVRVLVSVVTMAPLLFCVSHRDSSRPCALRLMPKNWTGPPTGAVRRHWCGHAAQAVPLAGLFADLVQEFVQCERTRMTSVGAPPNRSRLFHSFNVCGLLNSTPSKFGGHVQPLSAAGLDGPGSRRRLAPVEPLAGSLGSGLAPNPGRLSKPDQRGVERVACYRQE